MSAAESWHRELDEACRLADWLLCRGGWQPDADADRLARLVHRLAETYPDGTSDDDDEPTPES